MNYSDFFNDLKNLISFKSVEGVPTKDAPFGEEVKDALVYFLDLAKKQGFETINYDNYAGEIIVGEGEELGIAGHLDVVPVGQDWKTNPFELTEIGDTLYGRGVEDDKGPTLLCYYAIKDLIEEGVKFNKKIRFFVCTNEETGWKDIEYLKTKTTFPKYGFSPDGDFPPSYAEKGIYIIKIKLPKLKGFSQFVGGTVINAVCDYATAKAEKELIDKDLLSSLGLNLKSNNVIESFGVGAHGSRPSLGKNALKPMFAYMQKKGENLNNLVQNLFDDEIGLSSFANEQGTTTISPNLIVSAENGLELWCDCRLPAPLTIDDIIPTLNKIGLEYAITEKHPPFLVDKKGFLVTALNDAFNRIAKTNLQPQALGGSTFARVFEQGCAFGVGMPNVMDSCHQSNESLTKKHLLDAYKIYKEAIYTLVK